MLLVTHRLIMERLTNKNILITGASKGLGRAISLAFARENPSGIALLARHGDLLEKLKNEIHEIDPSLLVITIEADVGRPQDVERAAATTLDAFKGRLDVLINNASSIGPSPMPYLLDYPLVDFQEVLNTNLIAPFFTIRSLLPSMIELGGSIINVSSDAGKTGYPGWGAYGISKFGLEGLSQTWAAELENTPVRVNLVDPGPMDTAMHRAAEPDVDPHEWADPALVTDVFIFLASDESAGITGRRFEAQENWQETIKLTMHG